MDIPTSRSVVLDLETGRECRPLFELGLPTPRAWAAVRRPREQPGTVVGSDSRGSLGTEKRHSNIIKNGGYKENHL